MKISARQRLMKVTAFAYFLAFSLIYANLSALLSLLFLAISATVLILTLVDEVVALRSANIKVFRLNDHEWYAAESLEDAIAEAELITGLEYTEEEGNLDTPAVLLREHMDYLTFHDDGDGRQRSFTAQLNKMIREGQRFPCFFATTEW